jgi:hypothetical protein
MKYILSLASVALLILSCQSKPSVEVQSIVDRSIEVSGGEKYKDFKMSFDFRNRQYKTERKLGTYTYQRITKDSLHTIVEGYGNSTTFFRRVNDTLVTINDTLAHKITNAINSVNYFVLLPYGLNDAAVNKTYMGTKALKGQDYHKVKVTFNQDGGGDDFDDVYVYWFNATTHKVDYLAYSYHVNGGGMRFREAYNERYVNGLRIVDYNNYKPNSEAVALFDLDTAFEAGQLKLLSKIETENVIVE